MVVGGLTVTSIMVEEQLLPHSKKWDVFIFLACYYNLLL